MSRRPLINLGDLLTACKHTGAADEASVREIARMLGFSVSDEEASPELPEPKPRRERSSKPGEVPPPEKKPLPDSGGGKPPVLLLGRAPQSITEVTEPLPEQPPPAWIGQRLPPAGPEGSRGTTPLELEPLFRPSWTRNLIASAAATARPDGPLQLEALVELLCARRPIRHLPRRLRWTLRAGVQVLVDRSETMEPFSRDVELMLKRIPAVVGREHSQVLFFEGSPQHTGVGPLRGWREHQFQAGTPILALTCLGINAAPHRAMATALAWQRFADAAREAGCPLVAFVPYPPFRWPEGLSEDMVILEWDRVTSVGHARQLLRWRKRTS